MAVIYAGLAISVVYPLLAVLGQAFFEGAGLSVGKIREVFTTPNIIQAVMQHDRQPDLGRHRRRLGVTLAWLVARTDMPFKRVLDPLNMIPFYLSSVVGALSWQIISSPKTGPAEPVARAAVRPGAVLTIYSVGGIALVLGLFYTPYVYLFTLGSLQSMDPSLEEASRMSGASILKTALRVTLPLSAPAILSACLLVFVTCAGIFGVPMVLGIPGQVNTLSTLIFRSVNDYPADYATAAILSSALFVFTAVLIGLQVWLLRGKAFTTVTGKGYRPRTVSSAAGAGRALA